MEKKWVIGVHGGAWSIPDDQLEEHLDGVRNAVLAASKILMEGGSALDAVEAAIRVLEDTPIFDAGRGSVLNQRHEIEMDAMIMDGRPGLNTGAVCAVKTVKNPITLARRVMECTSHIMLAGSGADEFASRIVEQQQSGSFSFKFPVEIVTQESLTTETAEREWKKSNQYSSVVSKSFNKDAIEDKERKCDTVGAVALDIHGNLASGTSTGGITFKMPGRVGDSPIIGSGGFADNDIVAISVTGHGESIAKVNLSARIAFGIDQSGLDCSTAVKNALDYMLKKVKGRGGVIALTPSGQLIHQFSTDRMAFASLSSDDIQGVDESKIAEKITSSVE